MYKSLPKFCMKHSEGVTEHLRSLIWVLGMSLLACPWKCSRRRQAWWAKGSVRRVSSNHGRSDESKSFLQLEAHGQRLRCRPGINHSAAVVVGDLRNSWGSGAVVTSSLRIWLLLPQRLYLATSGAGLHCFQGLFVHLFMYVYIFRIRMIWLIKR